MVDLFLQSLDGTALYIENRISNTKDKVIYLRAIVGIEEMTNRYSLDHLETSLSTRIWEIKRRKRSLFSKLFGSKIDYELLAYSQAFDICDSLIKRFIEGSSGTYFSCNGRRIDI